VRCAGRAATATQLLDEALRDLATASSLVPDIAQEAGFQDEARREVEQMLALLPPARRAALYPDAAALAALVDRLSQDAVLAMTAAMRGTEAGSAP